MKRLLMLLALAGAMGVNEGWAEGTTPSIDVPHRTGASASGDAAVVIGVEDYPMLGDGYHVDYANRDADAFERFLLYTRGVPRAHINRMPVKSSKNQIRAAFKKAAKQADSTGILWFYFAGHGTGKVKKDGSDLKSGQEAGQEVEQVLLPYDMTTNKEDWEQRMLPISQLQEIADESKAQNALLIIDACYTTVGIRLAVPLALLAKSQSHTAVWSATQPGELSGPYEPSKHGAFTYAAVGALRGWADGERSGTRDGVVDLDEANEFVIRSFQDWNIRSQNPLITKSKLLNPRDLKLSPGYEKLIGSQEDGYRVDEVSRLSKDFEPPPAQPQVEAPASSAPSKVEPAPAPVSSKSEAPASSVPSKVEPAPAPVSSKSEAPAMPVSSKTEPAPAPVSPMPSKIPDKDAEAQYSRCLEFYNGTNGVAKDFRQAFVWCKKAADNGEKPAQYMTGLMLEKAIGTERDEARAVEYYKKAALQGDQLSQLNLGWMYLDGRGVERNEAEAAEWLEDAAQAGNKDAQNQLGWMFEGGHGVPEDMGKSFHWYKKAADQEQGDKHSQYKVAYAYEHGEGVAKDEKQAFVYYQKAAMQGYPQAWLALGVMYWDGRGTTKDAQKAVEWLGKAAKEHESEAQYLLGLAYHWGEGVDKNEQQALRWFKDAADLEHAHAQYMLGVMYEKGEGVPQDFKAASVWYKQAAEQDNADAQYALGMMYKEGRGVKKDLNKAKQLFMKAKDQNEEARKEAIKVNKALAHP